MKITFTLHQIYVFNVYFSGQVYLPIYHCLIYYSLSEFIIPFLYENTQTQNKYQTTQNTNNDMQ